MLPKTGHVILTSHDNPDPDALASSLALKTLIKQKTGLQAHIAIGGILGRAENRALTLALELELHPMEILAHRTWDAVVMLDAQPGAGNANLPDSMQVAAIIDHHPTRDVKGVPFVDIRPEYGAVSTILVEYLRAQDVVWDSKLATALFYAIKSETLELGRGICDADRRAYFALFDSVDWELLHRILHAPIPGDYFGLFPLGIDAAKRYGSAVITNLGAIPAPDAVAEIADFLLRHENVAQVLVIGKYEENLVFSIRFMRGELHAGMVANVITRDLGSGGGHEQMAGGRILLKLLRRTSAKTIEKMITTRFLEQVGASEFFPGEP
ncbi:MAG: DHH family phosphoesterase, partial [bacterium]